MKTAGAFAAGAAIAVSVAVPYSRPYREARARVGVRAVSDVVTHSARPSDYRLVSEGNFLYGSRYAAQPELALFPGYVAAGLAIVGLVLVRPSAVVFSYVIGMLLAFDLSLGLNGVVYPLLYQHVDVFKGLRAPARASIFVLMFLGVLAARGCAVIFNALPALARAGVFGAIGAAVVLEYWVVPVLLWPYPNRPPLYEFLARQPDGVVAEFPVFLAHDARYAYMSIFHWKRLVNGYSGYHPLSYMERIRRLFRMPDPSALAQLRADGVRYVIIHEGSYRLPAEAGDIMAALERDGMKPIARLNDGYNLATVFELKSP
jgi:hypothetical protein